MAEYKVYTKTGDKGQTSLIGGTRVSKSDARIEAYGTIDELNSYIGLIRDLVNDNEIKETLILIQDRLMTVSSILATDCTKCPNKLPLIEDKDIQYLENEIDKMDDNLPPLKTFVLPGGHQTVSFCHIARTVCRRSERRAFILEDKGILNLESVLKYLNRLSDYLFTLSRKLSTILNTKQIPWHPKLEN